MKAAAAAQQDFHGFVGGCCFKNQKKIPSCSVLSLTFADVMEQAAVSKGMCAGILC